MSEKKPITSDLIKDLRERTGVGMAKCKEALEATNGDIEKAIDNLRKSGAATAVKKEGRATNEGKIASASNANTVAIVEVNAETDFVVKNDRFQQFVTNIAEDIAKTKPATLEAFKNQKYSQDPSLTVEEFRGTLVLAIGENIQIRRLMTFTKGSDKSIGVYSHLGGKLLTLVEISGSNAEEELAKDIAMHIAAASPEYLSEKDVPKTVLENEKDIAKSQIKGKPENIVDKIVEGKINSYYDSACLLRQKYIKDDDLSINDLVNKHAKAKGKPLKVTNFVRWTVGQ